MTEPPKLERVLLDSDLQSPTWLRIEKYLNDRLATLRKENDQDLDERKTAKVRGRIEEVKKLLKLKESPGPR